MDDPKLRELQEEIASLRAELIDLRRARAGGLRRLIARLGISKRLRLALMVTAFSLAAASYAATISVPNLFVNGTIADADQVNANFDALVVESNDQDARIAALEASVGTLQILVGKNKTDIAANRSQIDLNTPAIAANTAEIATHTTDIQTNTTDIQTNETNIAANATNIGALNVTFAGISRAGTLLTFSGMNVQVVSGSGSTGGAQNGLGNLIVGYNENIVGASRTGSHNLVVGMNHEYTGYAGVVFGQQNTISAGYSTVTGGYDNTASGDMSTVSGGIFNLADATLATIGGGYSNTANSYGSSVFGGTSLTANGLYSAFMGPMSVPSITITGP